MGDLTNVCHNMLTCTHCVNCVNILATIHTHKHIVFLGSFIKVILVSDDDQPSKAHKVIFAFLVQSSEIILSPHNIIQKLVLTSK